MAATKRNKETSTPKERYTHGYGEVSEGMATRTAIDSAFFLLPHLKRGMRIIDCGSGKGSITISLAKAFAPGKVEGIELNPDEVKRAADTAKSEGVKNVRFQQGSVYELPFPDQTFDAAFAHTVLQHLAEPVKALKEMYRVLKPGGVVGVREEDWDAWIWHPGMPVVNEAMRIYREVWERNGGHPAGAKMHREWLRKAGFVRTVAGATSESWSGKGFGEVGADAISDPQYIEAAIGHGLADRPTLRKHVAGFRKFGAHPDAFSAVLMCHAVGWKD